MPSSEVVAGTIPLMSKNTENSAITGHKPPFWICFNFSYTFKTLMKQDNQSFYVASSRRGKDGAQPIISYMLHLIMIDMSLMMQPTLSYIMQ